MKAQDTGHLIEQPTKVSSFRPELGVFHGYTYERTSSSVIEVWVPDSCFFCNSDIRLSGHFVRIGSATDEEIQRHGLKKFEGAKPLRGLRPHSSAPFMCEPCKDRWLKGDGLETIVTEVL